MFLATALQSPNYWPTWLLIVESKAQTGYLTIADRTSPAPSRHFCEKRFLLHYSFVSSFFCLLSRAAQLPLTCGALRRRALQPVQCSIALLSSCKLKMVVSFSNPSLPSKNPQTAHKLFPSDQTKVRPMKPRGPKRLPGSSRLGLDFSLDPPSSTPTPEALH